MKKTFVIVITSILVVVVFLHTWAGRLSPVGRAGNYLAYRLHMGEPGSAKLIQKHGVNFYALYCRVNTWPVLSSGPPVYVFDDKGNLVDWTMDSGADQTFTNRWDDGFIKDIPVKEVDEILLKR